MTGTLKKILIADDEVKLAGILKSKLESQGFTVKVAADGEEAMKFLKEETFDLVLLDIIMPKMDGITVLKNMRLLETYKNTPVIILTNLSETEGESDFLANDSSEYLIKTDWSISDVVEKVKQRLSL